MCVTYCQGPAGCPPRKDNVVPGTEGPMYEEMSPNSPAEDHIAEMFASEHVAAPRIHRGRPCCPRCDAALRFDGMDLICVMCGYATDYTPHLPSLVSSADRSAERQGLAA